MFIARYHEITSLTLFTRNDSFLLISWGFVRVRHLPDLYLNQHHQAGNAK